MSLQERYSRQTLFPPIGEAGQKKLLNSFVVIVGTGALGTVLANNMVRAGIGRVRIIDRDFIEASNLQRQILFDEDDVKEGLPKAVAAERKLRKINSDIVIEGIVKDVNFSNIEELIEGANLVLDGSDNLEIRYLVNDACHKLGIPWIYGACVGSSGMTFNILPGKGPCLRCVLGDPVGGGMIHTCDTIGVISPIVNIIASIQSAEALKYLVGDPKLSSDMVFVDVWNNAYERVNLEGARRPHCLTCGRGNYEFLEAKTGTRTVFLCGRNAYQVMPFLEKKIDFTEVAARLEKLGRVEYNRFLLKFITGDYEIVLFNDGRAIIKGAQDEGIAKGLYAKYIGS